MAIQHLGKVLPHQPERDGCEICGGSMPCPGTGRIHKEYEKTKKAEMKVVEVELHDKTAYELRVRLSKKQLQVLQDALGFSACKFLSESSVKLFDKLHDEIKEQTGLKSSY